VFEIVNTPRDYSWGSTTAIATFLGTTPSGHPEAELWFGDHPSNPARLLSTGEALDKWGTSHPDRFGGKPLPFLVKILAAASPLSIQAHPTVEQARRGFDLENQAGIPLDSPERNYRDANHKPELIIALSEFSALCGFRPAFERDAIVSALFRAGVPGSARLDERAANGIRATVDWLLTKDAEVDALVSTLTAGIDPTGIDHLDDALVVARALAEHFPGDPGIAVSLLLNHVTLQPGDALFLPAGNVHAYLSGLGIEVMATSDNVLRGGLTPKHIDIPEFLAVLDDSELAEPRLAPTVIGPVRTFEPSGSEFAVIDTVVDGDVPVSITGPAIAVVAEGSVTLRAATDLVVHRGSAVFIEAGERLAELAGDGHVFIAYRPDGQ